MEAWSTALELVLTEGVSFKDSEGRICKEAMNLTITVLNPSKDIRKPIEELTKSLKVQVMNTLTAIEFLILI